MRLVFAGTPEFARVALEQLQAAGFEIALVLTQPDRPAGRGMKLQPSSVKQWASAHHIPVSQPRSLRLDGKYPEDARAGRNAIEAAGADAMVVAAYGLILPQWVLEMPRLGCFNIHASLLPRWRGAAPIHRAIEAGDVETGITIMQMDAGLDTGNMLQVEQLPIAFNDDTEMLHDKLAPMGGRLMAKVLEMASRSALTPVSQPTSGVTYAQKVEKSEAQLDWSHSAVVIERRIRAFNPFPGAFTPVGTDTIKLRKARVLVAAESSGGVPGQVLAAGSEGIDICTGDGVLRVLQLQKAGGKVLAAADFLRGFDMRPGLVWGHIAAIPG